MGTGYSIVTYRNVEKTQAKYNVQKLHRLSIHVRYFGLDVETLSNGLYGEATPERGTFIRPSVYAM